jgi:type II secretory pathway pseudopilin PulG
MQKSAQKTSYGALTTGFTLVELIVILGIITILASITLVAINPARHFGQSRDAQRRNDVTQILNAVNHYMADNNGSYPTGITSTPTEVADDGIDICSDLVTTYIAEMPVDPTNGSWTDCSDYSTDYLISVSASDSRITVTANTEDIAADGTITVTR